MSKRINLDSVVSKCVHRPIVKGDAEMTPLYKRNDGVFDNVGGKSTRSDTWMKTAEVFYASPNNVKRVFITYEGVYVHLYRPIKGDKSGELAKFYSFKSIDSEIDMMDALRSNRQRDREIVITKLGLGAVKRPWSCSNIEEIYFDWCVLLSDDIQNYGYADLVSLMTRKGTTTMQDGRTLWDLFSRSCLGSGEKVSNTFPRLKVIGYMDNLKRIYEIVGKPRDADSEGKLWFTSDKAKAVIQSAMRDPNQYLALYKVPNVALYNTKFLTRNYYTFDEEILVPYFAKLSEDITNFVRIKQGTLVNAKKEELAGKKPDIKETAKEVKKVVKSEYEQALDDNFDIVGEKGVYMSLKMMLNNLGKDAWLQLFREMSEEGRIKYQTIYSKLSKGGHN